MNDQNKTIEYLEKLCKEIRSITLDIITNSKSSHIGSAYSVVEILVSLYFYQADINKENLVNTNRDKIILSKGHACAALYAILYKKGFITKEDLYSFAKNNGAFFGHPVLNKKIGVDATTGSLGHGLSIGIGMALANKISKNQKRVYVIVSDGELNEGSTWEAILFTGHKKLDNLTLIIDYNKIQSFGKVEDVINLEPLKEKLKAFNWSVREINGHDIKELLKTYAELPFDKNKPSCIIAHTVKGKGVKFMENKIEWHYKSPSEEEYLKAKEELS
ncbi:MAG: transketolase [Candidatus Anstonellales archaeon]